MSKKALWAEVLLFLTFIALFFILNLALPDREFSEQENRYLQQKPAFSLSALFSGEYTADFESYTTDQFAFRDTWTALKARSELALGKRENNGVYLCEGETLIEGFDAPDTDALDSRLAAVQALAGNTQARVSLALIPGKSELYASLLPANAPSDSEAEVIAYCYGNAAVPCIDLLSPLRAQADEYIFYRTDHHWTSLGAYYGYAAIAGALGLDARGPEDFPDRRVVSESFYGTTWSASGFSWVAPDSMEIFVEAPEGLEVLTYETAEPGEGSLYDFSFLEKKDKYSMFLGGNAPLHEVRTGNDGPSLLLVRDSYADCLLPFLLEDFSEIHLLDLRYYRASLSAYIAEHGIDEVLVLYSVENFCTDQNLFLLGR